MHGNSQKCESNWQVLLPWVCNNPVSGHPEGLMNPLLALIPDAHSAVFKTAWNQAKSPAIGFPEGYIKHSRAIFAESHVKGLMSYWSSALAEPGFSPQPLPTWNVAVCVTGQPNPCFLQVIQGRGWLLLWITRRREGAAAGAALTPSQGVKKSSAVVGQPHERIRSKDSKLLPSTYWQTGACSLKQSPNKSGFFPILTGKWWALIVPFGSNCFLRSWCSSQIFLLQNRWALRGPGSCADKYLTQSLASAIRKRSSRAPACCSFTPCITHSPVPSSQLCTKARQWAWFTAAFLYFYLRIIPFKSEYGLD